MSPTLGRREQKKITNRNAILNAGRDVFSNIGYERATIADIVTASCLSVGTFYNYYGDKDTIFSELVTDFLSQVRAVLRTARNQAVSLETFVMGAFSAYSELITEHPEMQQLIAKNSNVFRQIVSAEGELIGIIEDLEHDMQAAIDSGLVPSFPVHMMTSAMIASSIEIFSGDQDSYSAKEKAEFLGYLFLGGIQRISVS
jgi:AcrR family transcriptional regulator